ncbi:hypothetical protein AOLI_G00286160 [Acnodon oligacanthus]
MGVKTWRMRVNPGLMPPYCCEPPSVCPQPDPELPELPGLSVPRLGRDEKRDPCGGVTSEHNTLITLPPVAVAPEVALGATATAALAANLANP